MLNDCGQQKYTLFEEFIFAQLNTLSSTPAPVIEGHFMFIWSGSKIESSNEKRNSTFWKDIKTFRKLN